MTRTMLTDGSPVTPDHREINPATGMQKGYVVLSAEERAKGFVEPVRRSYVHEKCGAVTTMGQVLAETYARDPFFYSGTFCVGCRSHFPVGEDGEFVWDGTSQKVGTRSPALSTPQSPRAAVTEAERDEDARDMRRRRWTILAEDGAIFGLTAGESAELTRLEAEFGPSGLAQEMRTP